MVHVYNGIYSAIRNDKYPPFTSTWMELEGIMLSEVSQSGKEGQRKKENLKKATHLVGNPILGSIS